MQEVTLDAHVTLTLSAVVDRLRDRFSAVLPPHLTATTPVATATLLRRFAVFDEGRKQWCSEASRTLEQYSFMAGVRLVVVVVVVAITG